MNKKVRKSTSIVSGVLISTSLINNAVSLASVGSMVKDGITALGKVAISTVEGGTDLFVVPAIKGTVTCISSYLFLFLLVYGFYYDKCVLHSGTVASSINAFISIPGLISSGIKTAFNYVFAKSKKPDDKNEVLEAKEKEDVEVISVENLRDEIGRIEKKLIESFNNNNKEELKEKVKVLNKRLEATRGSLNYKLNWLKFQLGASFRSETRKQYSELKTRLEEIGSGLDTVTDITEKWEKVKNNKEGKLSLLLLEKFKEKENPLVALIQEVKTLEGSKNNFLKQYRQTFFNEYIKELKVEVIEEFKRIVEGEKENREDAFRALILRLNTFSKAEPQFSGETKKWCDHLKCMYELLLGEEQITKTLKDCGVDCFSTVKQLLDFVFKKDFIDQIVNFFGAFIADDANKSEKELKEKEALNILEKIASNKDNLKELNGAITSAMTKLKRFEENDLSKSILGKVKETKKMLDFLFEEKGGEVKENIHLVSVATKYAEISSQIKEIEEKKFDNEDRKGLNTVLTLLVSFYEDKLKDLDNLLEEISTFKGKYNENFVNCLEETVSKLKNRYDKTKTALDKFAREVMDFSSSFESDREKQLDGIAKKLFAEENGSIDFILGSLESYFKKEVCVLGFGEIEEVNGLWEDWKQSFINKYKDGVNKKVEALKKEAEEKEKQEEKDVSLIQKTKETINSFKLSQNFNLDDIENLKLDLENVSKKHKKEAEQLEANLDFLKESIVLCLSDKHKLSEKIMRTTAFAKTLFQVCPGFLESVLTYLSEQFDLLYKQGRNEDFYKCFLCLNEMKGILSEEVISKNNGMVASLENFYKKVRKVVLEKAEESIKNNKDLVENFDKEIAAFYKRLTSLKGSAEKIGQSSDLNNLALFFLEYSRLEKYIKSNPIASYISSFNEKVSFIGEELKKKFSSIKLDEFLLNFFTLPNEETSYLDAFVLCLNSPELNFFAIKNVGDFFDQCNGKKNFGILSEVRVNLQRLKQFWNRSDFSKAETNLKTVLKLLSEFKGDEKVIRYIKSAVVSFMSNIFCDYFIARILRDRSLKVFDNFSGGAFTELFKLFDEAEIIDDKNSENIKRLWFLSLFGNFYNRGIGDTKWVDMVKDSKFISDINRKNLVLGVFNTLDGGFEGFPALPDDEIKSSLETFFGSDKDFANIAYSIFASYKKEFRFNDLAGKSLNIVGNITGDIAKKSANVFGEFKNFFGGLGLWKK